MAARLARTAALPLPAGERPCRTVLLWRTTTDGEARPARPWLAAMAWSWLLWRPCRGTAADDDGAPPLLEPRLPVRPADGKGGVPRLLGARALPAAAAANVGSGTPDCGDVSGIVAEEETLDLTLPAGGASVPVPTVGVAAAPLAPAGPDDPREREEAAGRGSWVHLQRGQVRACLHFCFHSNQDLMHAPWKW